jgi:hypothetical protein
MAATEERAADLSRRVRDDLIHWGIVDGEGTSIGLRRGYRASRGDLLMARRNDKHAIRGDPAGQITNRDVLQLTDPDPDGTGTWAQVRRLESYDPATGQRQWSGPFRLTRSYLRKDAHLGYAVTIHSGQAQTRGPGTRYSPAKKISRPCIRLSPVVRTATTATSSPPTRGPLTPGRAPGPPLSWHASGCLTASAKAMLPGKRSWSRTARDLPPRPSPHGSWNVTEPNCPLPRSVPPN